MAKKSIALEVKNISKSFHLPTEQASGIKQAFINLLKGVKGYTEQKVLKDISFTVEKGDFFGIVGRNGSGKSTLLKLISQIYEPDSGDINVNGKLVPFIELGVGFNPELTGRENVYLNGALLGFSHDEVSAMYAEIVEFAELEKFMDQKLKNYSSGMQVRLAFSIAIKAQGDILVLDEVLAVGDEAFQRKCFNYFAELKRDKKTVILVTHSMEQVQQFCNKALLIDKSGKTIIGDPGEVAHIYREINNTAIQSTKENNDKTQISSDEISVIPTFNNTGSKLIFDIEIKTKKPLNDVAIAFLINRNTGEVVYRFVTDEKTEGAISLRGSNRLHIELDNIFPNGMFDVTLSIKKKDRTRQYIDLHKLIEFEIVNAGSHPGDVYWKPEEEYELS